ncbi:MAG: hypothetical protein JO112_03985 [Planctomycetes bacterium]|nr:hypothetical protein [Planctomycetota bacterium]
MTVPSPTQGEVIRQLTKEVATLNERISNMREQMNELKRLQEETSRKRWALLPPVLGALVNGLIAFLVAYFVAHK